MNRHLLFSRRLRLAEKISQVQIAVSKLVQQRGREVRVCSQLKNGLSRFIRDESERVDEALEVGLDV